MSQYLNKQSVNADTIKTKQTSSRMIAMSIIIPDLISLRILIVNQWFKISPNIS